MPYSSRGNKKYKKYEYEMGGVKLESVQCVKDLGVTITSNLKFSQQCKEAACKANRMLGFIKRIFPLRKRYNSTYVQSTIGSTVTVSSKFRSENDYGNSSTAT